MLWPWDARLGVLVPSANAVMERDAAMLLPALPGGVTAHFARMKLTRDDADQIEGLIDHVPTAADAGVDAIAFACTTGSLIRGLGYDDRICQIITEVTGSPATTTSTAVVDALHALGIAHPVLVSPYEEWLANKVVQFLAGHGVEVVGNHHRDLPEPRDADAVTPEEISRAAREAIDAAGDRADGVFISCTGFRGLEACALIEDELGLPAVSSNQATFWHLLRLVGITPGVTGFGRLLDQNGSVPSGAAPAGDPASRVPGRDRPADPDPNPRDDKGDLK